MIAALARFWLACAFASPLAVAAPDISVSVQPDQAEVGLLMSVTVTISGNESLDCDLLQIPDIDGGRMRLASGPSTRSTFTLVNGRRSNSVMTKWEFELVPEREGALEIPPFRFNCRGSEVASRTQVVIVRPSTLPKGLVRIEVEPATRELWLGQVVDIAVRFLVVEAAYDNGLRNGLEFSLPWLTETPALHMLEPSMPNCRVFLATMQPSGKEVPTCLVRDTSSGVSMIVHEQVIPMLAIESGTVTLDDARFDFRLVLERQQSRRSPFQLFGSLNSVPSRVVVASTVEPGPTITIREPPALGRPAGYTNAVGRFRFDGRAEPRQLVVGESCKLTLALAVGPGSSGHLGMIEWPEYDVLSEDFRIFGKEDERGDRVRELVLELAPKNERVDAIPVLEFSFFDPELGSYETLTVGPFDLDVAPGGTDGLTELSTPEELLNDLETIRERLPAPVSPPLPAWSWPVMAGVLLLFNEWRARRRQWRDDNPATVARRGARRRLNGELAEARDAAAVATAFARYLARRFGGPPGGLTLEEALPQIDDEAAARRLTEVMTRWEASYLGGAPLPVETVVVEARELADLLERVS